MGSKRGNGEGSIYQRSDGRWVAVLIMGQDDKGKQKKKYLYGYSRNEVAKKLAVESGKYFMSPQILISNEPLEVMLFEWLMLFKKPTVSSRTFDRNMHAYRTHIVPAIGKMKIEDITTPVVQKFLNVLLLKGYSIATVKKSKFLLRQFFEYCEDTNLVIKNPVTRTRIRRIETKVYNQEDAYKAIPPNLRKEFLKALEKETLLKTLCKVGMFAGLRIGEILALKWRDIDFEKELLKVETALSVIYDFNEMGYIVSKSTVISNTKTSASIREVPMPKVLVQELKEWREVRKKEELTTGINVTNSSNLIFCNKDGSLRTYDGTKAIFNRFIRRNKFQKYKFHFHTLRHTYSNMLFETGENPKVIQQLLGHKSLETTLMTYNSIDRSYFSRAITKLNFQLENLLGIENKTVKEEDKNNQEQIERMEQEQIKKIEQNQKEKILTEKERRLKELEEFNEMYKAKLAELDNYVSMYDNEVKKRKKEEMEME